MGSGETVACAVQIFTMHARHLMEEDGLQSDCQPEVL